MKNFLLSICFVVLGAIALFKTMIFVQKTYNPVEIGNVYTEQISENPFSTDIPDTAIVIDIKGDYVKYKVKYRTGSGRSDEYIGSGKILPFKLYYTKIREK